MNSFTIRRVSNAVFTLTLLLTILFIAISTYLLYSVYVDKNPMFGVFVFLYSVMLYLPLSFIVIIILIRYATKITFTESQLAIVYPLRKTQVIEYDDIHAAGRISFSGNNTKFFICTSKPNEILAFLNQNLNFAKRLFDKEQVKQLMETADGRWKMALSIYISFSKSKNIFFIEHHSDVLLSRLATILEEKVIILSKTD